MNKDISKQFEEIKNSLESARNILIASHENPDVDALGSMLALGSALKKIDKKTFLYSPDRLPDYLYFLPGINEIITDAPLPENIDFIFCLDYGDFQRLKLSENFSEKKIITIDHHLESSQKGFIKIVEPGFSSTSEIIYLLINHLEIEMDKGIASCLLAGILYDTGGLKHISTSSQTLKIVSELLSEEVSLESVSRRTLTAGKSLTHSKIWAEALSRIVFDQKRRFAFSWIAFDDFKKYQISFSDLDGISSLISTISDASFSLFLIEHERGKIKGSLRSEPHKGKNIIELAKALGGNGHSFAAGFKQDGSIEEVLKKVYNLID